MPNNEDLPFDDGRLSELLNKDPIELAGMLGEILVARKLRVTTAESCTGGNIAKSLCAAQNTPEFYGCGFVSFTDEAKHRLLHVRNETLETWTAVSQQTAMEMATGACEVSKEPVSIAVTGYAGPDGGEDGTPAGTVWFGWVLPEGRVLTIRRQFEGDPQAVLEQAVKFALGQLIVQLDNTSSAE